LSKDKIETEDEIAIREWLAAGNKVTVCEPDLKTEEEDIIYKWVRGRPKPKPKVAVVEDTKKVKEKTPEEK